MLWDLTLFCAHKFNVSPISFTDGSAVLKIDIVNLFD